MKKETGNLKLICFILSLWIVTLTYMIFDLRKESIDQQKIINQHIKLSVTTSNKLVELANAFNKLKEELIKERK